MISWRPGPDREGGHADAAALLAMAQARQAASPTALAQARLPPPRRRTGAAFARSVAAALATWHVGPGRMRRR
ncbi:MAG: hypothetical protein ACRYFW_03295 [Janthinobacterium lividum]